MATVKPILRDSGPTPFWKTAEAIPINYLVTVTTASTIALAASGDIAWPVEEAVPAAGESATLILQGKIGRAHV